MNADFIMIIADMCNIKIEESVIDKNTEEDKKHRK